MSLSRHAELRHPVEDLLDSRVADYRDLQEKEGLRARGCFVAESRHVVRRLLAEPRFPVRSLFLTDAAACELAADLEAIGCTAPVYIGSRALLSDVAGYRVHQGCLAIAERAAEPTPQSLVRTAAEAGRSLVVLEELANPDNVGAIFRNAQGFGVGGVLLVGGADPLYRKALRVSMGATLALPFAHARAWPQELELLRAAGFTTLAAVVAGEGDPVEVGDIGTRLARPSRFALLLGTESAGLSAAARGACDLEVTIRTAGSLDSLNVASASAVLLHRLQAP